jgi:hypothetical protein
MFNAYPFPHFSYPAKSNVVAFILLTHNGSCPVEKRLVVNSIEQENYSVRLITQATQYHLDIPAVGSSMSLRWYSSASSAST